MLPPIDESTEKKLFILKTLKFNQVKSSVNTIFKQIRSQIIPDKTILQQNDHSSMLMLTFYLCYMNYYYNTVVLCSFLL